jgi:hypothetical protein
MEQAPTVTATSASTVGAYSPVIVPNGLTDFNIFLANNQYYESNLQLPVEFYREFKANCPLGNDDFALTSMVDYFNYLNIYRYHLFDITRSQGKPRDPNKPVSIVLKFRPQTTGTYDMLYIIERLQRVVFDFKNGTVSVANGDI